MEIQHLNTREMTSTDIDHIVDYWLYSDQHFLERMGVDLKKMPSENDLRTMLASQLTQDYKNKSSYCTIWEIDGKPVGHSNVNKIQFGVEAYMHLHLWSGTVRRMGEGTRLVRMSLPYFFKNLLLQRVLCEPYALNPAPNKTLPKAGFRFVRSYTCVPGSLNFEQPVNLWEITRSEFMDRPDR
jgi:RimJ/RimL family protein N-acetyltransferase